MSQGGNILYDRRLTRLEVVKPSISQISDTVTVTHTVPDPDTDYTFLELPPVSDDSPDGRDIIVQLPPRLIDNPFKTLVVVPPAAPAVAAPQCRFVIKFGPTVLITLQTAYASAMLLWKGGRWTSLSATSFTSSEDRLQVQLPLVTMHAVQIFDNMSTCSIINRVLFVQLDVVFQTQTTGPHGVLSMELPATFRLNDTQGTSVACVDDTGFLSPATVTAFDNQIHVQVFMFDRDRVYTCKGQFFTSLDAV